MCGRYSLFVPPSTLEETFGVSVPRRYEPRYNAAPGQDLPVVRGDVADELSYANWGLVPSWVDDPEDANRPINARSETVREKPTFRAAFEAGSGDGAGGNGAGGDSAGGNGAKGDDGEAGGDGATTAGRCLVPADGFYEWKATDAGKRPYRVTMADDEPFAMAGLYAVWEGVERQTGLDAFAGGSADPDPTRLVTFAVLTTEPNDVVADLHHRMAVVLAPSEYETWLHGDAAAAEALLDPAPADGMRAYPVSTAVNDPSNDSPMVAEPVDVEG